MSDQAKPSYHDLYITTEEIPRKSIFDLPFNLMVTCTRTGGWELWRVPESGLKDAEMLAGEYAKKWLVLDLNGELIVDGRNNK